MFMLEKKINARVFSYRILYVLVAMLTASTAGAADLSIWGVGHLSYDAIDTGGSLSTYSVSGSGNSLTFPQTGDYVHSNSSRLGIKAEQDLGDGLSVYVRYDSGVDLTGHGTGDGNGGATSGGQVFTRSRDSFLGLKSAQFGSIQFGRLDGLNAWLYDYNLFADQVGDLGNIWGGDGLPGRLDNAVEYLSPTWHGVGADVTYVPSEGGATSQRSGVFKVNYSGGGVHLGAAYAQFGTSTTTRQDAYAITGSYDFGSFNLGGGYQREANIGGVSGADRNQATLGGSIKLGENGTFGALKVQYVWSGGLSGVPDSTAHQISMGYDYMVGKSTTVYLAYARTTNSVNTAYSAYDYGHGDQGTPAIVAGKSPSAISFGLIYKFNVGLLK